MPPLGKSLEEITKNKRNLRKDISKLQKEILSIESSENFKLDEESKKNYNSWKDLSEKSKKTFKNLINPIKDEKDYAIRIRQCQISLYEHSLKSLICEEKGHKESVISLGNHGTYVECKRCGEHYTRDMNVE